MAIKYKGDGDGSDGNVVSLGTAMGVRGDPDSHMTIVKTGTVSKQDKAVLSGTQLEKDDAFEAFFFDPRKNDPEAQVLRPPFQPQQLAMMCQRNNTLGQLIAAMEVNIDGTGWEIERAADDEENDPKKDDPAKERLEDWFKEPFPRTSFTTLRRETRRDMEQVGYGFMEVLRSIDGELMFLKHIPAHQMRLVKLDAPVMVEQKVQRDGQEMDILMNVRERRFAQVMSKRVIYFKEYGASRDLDRLTGEWAKEGETLDVKDRATEVLYFTVYEDAATPYGVPRWINQIPSVLGSRKAEELNLDFFNSGGLPPALIIVQGGELTPEVRKQLQQYMSGKGSSYHRAGIVEVAASGGSLDSPGNVRVTVERFGSERIQDSMFENYDARCEERTRSSFRLPPIFVGKSQDYSFATAFASYTVTEAQVFQPERSEFDEVINNTVMRELDPDGEFVFRSMPLTVDDVATKLEALGIVKDDLTRETRVSAINEIVGMTLVPDDADPEPEPEPVVTVVAPVGEPPAEPGAPVATPAGAPKTPPNGSQPSTPPARKLAMDTFGMMDLVGQWCRAQMTDEIPESEIEIMRLTIERMDLVERQRFDGYCTMKMMSAMDHDMMGAVELVGAASSIAEKTDDCKH